MTTESAIEKLRATFEHGSISLPPIALDLQQLCGVKPKSLENVFKALPAMFKDDPKVAATLSNLFADIPDFCDVSKALAPQQAFDSIEAHYQIVLKQNLQNLSPILETLEVETEECFRIEKVKQFVLGTDTTEGSANKGKLNE